MLWEECVAERERESESLGAIALDRSLSIIHVSDGVVTQSGLDRESLMGRHPVELVHPDDAARAAVVLDEVQSIPGERPEGIYRLRLSDGTHRFFTIRATNLGRDDDDTIVLDFREPTEELRAQAFADDVVDLMRMLSTEVTLDESFDWVAAIAERHVEGLQIVITTFEDDGPNRVFSRKPIPADVRERSLAASPTDLPVHVEVAYEQHRQGPWRSSRKIASLDYIKPGRLTSILAGRDGAIVGYVEAFRQTAETPDSAEWLVHGMISRMMTAALHRFEFDRQLRRAADVDPLTGLLNRRKLFEVLGADEHLAGSLLYLIDLDRFSWVNNNLGHQAGDETLTAVAKSLVDVCPDRSLIARLGGDEFVVWIPTDQSDHDLESLGDQISGAIVTAVSVDEGHQVWVRGSIGMVRIAAGESAADALNRADVAMYASKRSGGDSSTVG